MYQETLQYYHLWRLAVQERDEARELLKQSLTELSQLQELFNTLLLPEEQKLPLLYNLEETTTEDHQKCNYYNHFSGDYSPARSGSDCYSFRSNQSDFESVVLEMIGGTLPENGKFLEGVSKSSSSVESLFISGPVPKWRNPPVQSLSQRPVLSTGNWYYGGGLEFGSGILNRPFLGKMSQFSST